MVPNAHARHFRIKAAQRDLIAAAGGIERAADFCSYGKSTVGRWANIDAPEWMPLDAVDKLESETGLTHFTRAWVETRGLKLAEPDAREEQVACLTTEIAGFVGEFGTLMAEWALTSADGHATPGEANRLRRFLPTMRDRLSKIEEQLAAIHAAGGLSLVKSEKGAA